jgi:DNA-binding NarL/FixJ family response regulator
MGKTENYIVELIRQGLTNKEIADRIHKQKRAVDDIIHRMLRKNKCKNRTELAMKDVSRNTV